MILGIDASRCRSGGSIEHIVNILNYFNPYKSEINEIHIWTYDSLKKSITKKPYLKVHSPKLINKNLIFQLIWQLVFLKYALKKNKCNLLFSADACSFCTFKPMIVLHQDMLSFEKNIIKKYSWGYERLRLLLIKIVQMMSIKNSDANIFLTQYSYDIINQFSKHIKNHHIIPHGVNKIFFNNSNLNKGKYRKEKFVFKILCV